MTPYAEIEIHGTPAGYKAGCKTDAMCDPSAPWSCRRGYERARGDYAFNMRLKQGMSPAEIHELEQADAQRLAEEEAAWLSKEGLKVPAKPRPAKPATARKGSRLPLVDPGAGPSTRVAPDRLAAYGANGPAAMERIASAPSITDLATSHAALAKELSREAVIPTPSKETPMTAHLPAGVEWKAPSPSVLAASGPKSKNQRIIEAAKQRPREWMCLGPAAASAATRWRKGDVTGTKPSEFEAVVDTGAGTGNKGDLYVRYVGDSK